MIEKGFMEGIGTAVQDWAQTRNRMRLMRDCCGVHRRAFVSFSVYRARQVSSASQRLVNADLYRGEASQKTLTLDGPWPGFWRDLDRVRLSTKGSESCTCDPYRAKFFSPRL